GARGSIVRRRRATPRRHFSLPGACRSGQRILIERRCSPRPFPRLLSEDGFVCWSPLLPRPQSRSASVCRGGTRVGDARFTVGLNLSQRGWQVLQADLNCSEFAVLFSPVHPFSGPVPTRASMV